MCKINPNQQTKTGGLFCYVHIFVTTEADYHILFIYSGVGYLQIHMHYLKYSLFNKNFYYIYDMRTGIKKRFILKAVYNVVQ